MSRRRFTAVLVPVAMAMVVVPVDLAAAAGLCNGLSATITGDAGAEELKGTRGRDVIQGGGGNDVILGRGGRDVICGGKGNDALSGGGDADRLFGDGDLDVLDGGPGNDYLSGEKGRDVASFLSARRPLRVDLGPGRARGQGVDVLEGIESAVGGKGDDVIRGTRRVNLLAGGVGDDRLFGHGGNDVIQPLEGDDFADGGRGLDLLSYSLSTTAVAIDPVDGDGSERLRSFEALQGSSFPDVIAGTDGDDVLLGWDGGDQFRPRGGDDYVDGQGITWDQDEVVYQDSPRRVVVDLVTPNGGVDLREARGDGTDVLVKIDDAVGSRFDDEIIGGAADDTFAGLGGDDRITIGGGGTATGGDGADVLTGSGFLFGDDGNDRMTGAADQRGGVFAGGRGHDVFVGSEGADTFIPGPGDDSISGGAPSGVVNADLSPKDAVSYVAAESGVVVDLTTGAASGEGADTLDDVEDVDGSPFDDVITGDELVNVLRGDAGEDRIDAGAAFDAIDGGPGDDVISGGDADDVLWGGVGIDSADGGPGDDACDAEQTIACERAPRQRAVPEALPGVVQASRLARHLRKTIHAITDSGNVTRPTSPISELRNLSRLV